MRAAALSRTALFSGLNPATMDHLAAMAVPVSFATGAAVFRKGDPSHALYVVVRGRVKIAATSAEGREIVLNVLGPGAVFGEIALIDGGGRTADAVAYEPLHLVALGRNDLVPYLEANPRLMLQMLVVMAQRIRWVSSSLEDSTFLGLPARLAKRLLILGELFGLTTPSGRRLTIALPQRELAGHMNVTRETINRLLHDWLGRNLIAIDRGVIVLKDMDRLAEIAEGAERPI